MKINQNIALSNPKLLLVPYSARHVPTYHAWMQSPDLQSATASEPLNLDEEYVMQRSWRTDPDKLTFIICLPVNTTSGPADIAPGVADAADRMIGDVNLFLFDAEPDDVDENEVAAPPAPQGDRRAVVGELELMIARPSCRRRGYGRAALLVFIDYIRARWDEIAAEYDGNADSSSLSKGTHTLSPHLAYLRVKINQANVGSIALFEQSLGFRRTAEGVNYFGEVELRLYPGSSMERKLVDAMDSNRGEMREYVSEPDQ